MKHPLMGLTLVQQLAHKVNRIYADLLMDSKEESNEQVVERKSYTILVEPRHLFPSR